MDIVKFQMNWNEMQIVAARKLTKFSSPSTFLSPRGSVVNCKKWIYLFILLISVILWTQKAILRSNCILGAVKSFVPYARRLIASLTNNLHPKIAGQVGKEHLVGNFLKSRFESKLKLNSKLKLKLMRLRVIKNHKSLKFELLIGINPSLDVHNLLPYFDGHLMTLIHKQLIKMSTRIIWMNNFTAHS